MDEQLFRVERLHEFAARVFAHHRVSPADAERAAEVLTAADLRGIDSHGVARLHFYAEMFENGRLNPRPNIRVVRESPSTATVDGDNGLGLVVGPRANDICMEKAETAGTGWVSVRNSNHYGIAGAYVLQGLGRDRVTWPTTDRSKLLTPRAA